MLTIDWDVEKGWTKPKIHPHSAITLDPSASVFHYAIECFEGMKAYKDKNGQSRLFRPLENMRRLNSSASRLVLPVCIIFKIYISNHLKYNAYFNIERILTKTNLLNV